LAALQLANDDATSLLQKLQQDLSQAASLKDEVQNDLFRKFAVILNSKKRKISELEEALASIQEAILVPPDETTDPPPSRSSRISKPKVKRTRSQTKRKAKDIDEGEENEEEVPQPSVQLDEPISISSEAAIAEERAVDSLSQGGRRVRRTKLYSDDED
jgi:hypothetical protein